MQDSLALEIVETVVIVIVVVIVTVLVFMFCYAMVESFLESEFATCMPWKTYVPLYSDGTGHCVPEVTR